MFFLRPELPWYFTCLLDVQNWEIGFRKPSPRLLKSSRKLGDVGKSSHRQSRVSSVSRWQSEALRGTPEEVRASKQEERKIRFWP